MTTTTVQGTGGGSSPDGTWALYKGWVVGFAIVLLVLAIGAALWLAHHP